MVKHLACYLTDHKQKSINSSWLEIAVRPQIWSLAPFILNVFTQIHHVFINEAIDTKTTLFNIGRRQIWMSIYSYTFSWNIRGHSIQKSILFLSVEIQNEIRVNLINESRWHLLNSFCSGAAEVDATAPLPPSNKYMDNCWPRLLNTLTSCFNNWGGTQLGQLLLLLLAVRQ